MTRPRTIPARTPVAGRRRMALAISHGFALTAVAFGAPVHPTLLSVRTRGSLR